MTFQEQLGEILNDYWVGRNEARPNGVKASHAHKEAKAQLTQLFKEEVEQIIGDDEPHTKYMKGRSSTTDVTELRNWSKVISNWRNELRADQRARLNKTIEEK